MENDLFKKGLNLNLKIKIIFIKSFYNKFSLIGNYRICFNYDRTFFQFCTLIQYQLINTLPIHMKHIK